MWAYFLLVSSLAALAAAWDCRAQALAERAGGTPAAWSIDSPATLVATTALLLFAVPPAEPAHALVTLGVWCLAAVYASVAALGLALRRHVHVYLVSALGVAVLWLAHAEWGALETGAALLLLLQEYEMALRRRTGPVVVWERGVRYGPAGPLQETLLVWPMYSVMLVALGTVLDAYLAPPAREITYRQIGACLTGAVMSISLFCTIDLPSFWMPGWSQVTDRLARLAVPVLRRET